MSRGQSKKWKATLLAIPCDTMFLRVTEEYITQVEAVNRLDLSRLPAGASETVRVVNIGDYDQCLCAGTHVGRTGEIGHFRISSSRWELGVQRIVFRLD